MSGRDIIEFEATVIRDLVEERFLVVKHQGKKIAIPRSQYWGKTQTGKF